MNFSCPSCRAKYYVADEMVIGRTLKMKCRKCPAEIPIQGRPTSVAPRLKDDDSTPPSAGSGTSSISSDRLRLSLPYRRVDAMRPPPAGPSLPPQASEDQPLSYRIAIAGKSEGPFGLEDIRLRMERGEVTPQSFVWRAGMARWSRLGDVAELSFLVESLPPPSSTPPLSVRPEALMDAEIPESLEEKEARAKRIEEELGFGDFSQGATPSRGGGRTAELGSIGQDVDARGEGKFRPAELRPTELRPTELRPTKVGLAASPSEGPVIVPTGSRSGRRLAVVSALIGSLALGFLLGNWLSLEPRQSVIREVVEIPVETLAENVPPPDPGGSEPTVAAPGEPPSTRPPPQANKPGVAPSGRAATSGLGVKSAALGASTASDSGLPGLGDLAGPGGPAGPATVGQAEAGPVSTQLSAAQIKRAIANYQAGVKRGCWQPALEGRSTMAPSTARVAVELSVGRDGSVSRVASSGDPSGYPGLASCIEGKVRAFRFPASGGETRVTIPFVFAAQ